jgi:hypothetical protein
VVSDEKTVSVSSACNLRNCNNISLGSSNSLGLSDNKSFFSGEVLMSDECSLESKNVEPSLKSMTAYEQPNLSNDLPCCSYTSSPPLPIVTAIHDYDVSCYREKVKGFNRMQILNLFQIFFKPDPSFCFPKEKGLIGRSFLFKWFGKWSWLTYSPNLNAAFCLSCVLFGDQFPTKNSKVGFLFSEPLSDWRQATVRFSKHEGSHKSQNISTFDGLHKHTNECLIKLISDYSGHTEPINVMIDSQTTVENL